MYLRLSPVLLLAVDGFTAPFTNALMSIVQQKVEYSQVQNGNTHMQVL